MKPLIDGDKYYVTMCGKVFVKKRRELLYGRHPTPYIRVYPEKELKTHVNKLGYRTVGMTYNGERVSRFVHRLVANQFIPNPHNLPEVNHVNGDKSDCRVINLEWVTRQGNALHSTRVLGKNRGEDNSASVLTEKQVLEIKELLAKGYSQTEVSNMFDVTNGAIYRIQHGYNWSWLTGFGRKGAVNETTY